MRFSISHQALAFSSFFSAFLFFFFVTYDMPASVYRRSGFRVGPSEFLCRAGNWREASILHTTIITTLAHFSWHGPAHCELSFPVGSSHLVRLSHTDTALEVPFPWQSRNFDCPSRDPIRNLHCSFAGCKSPRYCTVLPGHLSPWALGSAWGNALSGRIPSAM